MSPGQGYTLADSEDLTISEAFSDGSPIGGNSLSTSLTEDMA